MTTDRKRFTKSKLIADLRDIAAERQKLHKFECGNGYAQVEGQGEERNRDFGEWIMLRHLARWIECGEIGK